MNMNLAIDEQNDLIPETLVAPPTWTVVVCVYLTAVVTISMLRLTKERKARQRLQRVNTTRARGRQASIVIVIRERDERTSQEILIDTYTTICSLILELDSRTNNLIRITLGEGSD